MIGGGPELLDSLVRSSRWTLMEMEKLAGLSSVPVLLWRWINPYRGGLC
jgi:hypothetical protein